MKMRQPFVLPNDDGIRPAGPPDACFYCQQTVGNLHQVDCVTIRKVVKIRMIAEYEVEVPQTWTEDDILFHRNEGSWCAGNSVDEINRIINIKNGPCGCDFIRYEMP